MARRRSRTASAASLLSGGARDNVIGGVRPLRRSEEAPFLPLAPELSELAAGNLISANVESGIRIVGEGSDGNLVLGNLIGVSLGEEPLGNGGDGVTIAEGDPGLAHVIRDHAAAGVVVSGAATSGHRRGSKPGNTRFRTTPFFGGRGGTLPRIGRDTRLRNRSRCCSLLARSHGRGHPRRLMGAGGVRRLSTRAL
jgi:hypothetical protein